jgi:hypothetical protein
MVDRPMPAQTVQKNRDKLKQPAPQQDEFGRALKKKAGWAKSILLKDLGVELE